MSKASPTAIFLTFLQVGATSFGGGVVALLRDALVRDKQWFDDVEFLEITSISNALPGLNSTNMAILAGDRLGGTLGSILAVTAMCLPSFVIMTAAGFAYASHHSRPLVNAALRGVAAGATGLIAATWFKIGKKSMKGFYDGLFVIASILGVNYFKLSVPVVLLIVGVFALIAFRPRAQADSAPAEEEAWIKSLS